MTTHAVISIDLGIKNLGWTVLMWDGSSVVRIDDMRVRFGVYNIDANVPKRMNTVVGRCESLRTFFGQMTEAAKGAMIEAIVIERQVSRNTMAMGLMYATTALAMEITDEVVIFDPKSKFNKVGVTYVTERKQHKKQSIRYAGNVLRKWWRDGMGLFESMRKKDDVSDAIIQGLVWLMEMGFMSAVRDELVMVMVGEDVKVEIDVKDAEDEMVDDGNEWMME